MRTSTLILPNATSGQAGPISTGITLSGLSSDYIILAMNGAVNTNAAFVNSATLSLTNVTISYSGGSAGNPATFNWAVIKKLPTVDTTRNVVYSNIFNVVGTGARSQDFTIPSLDMATNIYGFYATIQAVSDASSQLLSVRQLSNTSIRIRVNSNAAVVVGVAVFISTESASFT
jgi:hypothetical protein